MATIHSTSSLPTKIHLHPSLPMRDMECLMVYSITLYPLQLPDAAYLQSLCHVSRVTAELLAQRAQRIFTQNYLDREVNPQDGRQGTDAAFSQLSEWGLPANLIREEIVGYNSRNNTRSNGAPQTDGASAVDIVALPTAIDDTLTDASWDDAEDPGGGAGDDAQNGDGHALRRTLYYIAEDQARQKGIVHRGITCDGCRTTPIRGVRYRCTNCVDYDLCSDCEATNIHPKTHMFQKVKIPARYLGYTRKPMPVYFPGNPNFMPNLVPNAVKKAMEDETDYDPEEIEGLWEQFTCLANIPWDHDPHKLGAAIDRRAFDKAFVPRYTANIPAPNLVYDRVFTFFDSNGDGLIGFEEFVKGMNYIRMSPRMKSKLKKIFECYDVDGDGFVTRKDFLRIFRAYYNILREKTRDMLMVAEESLSVAGAMDTVESSQPLSSAFISAANFPTRRNGVTPRKTFDRFGDPQQDQEVVRESGNDAGDRSEFIADAGEIQSQRTSSFLPQPSSPELARRDAVADRWRRREFYIDEEEGLTAPDNMGEDDRFDESTAHDTAGPSGQTNGTNGVYHRPSMSRSSSRVRFADDLESDARSEASTSSRPIGERWGGYEIPEAEEDLGKDILYQMLDPLFRRKEDLALEREHWRAEIERFAREIKQKTDADFFNDPLLRSPEAEALLDVSLHWHEELNNFDIKKAEKHAAVNAARQLAKPEGPKTEASSAADHLMEMQLDELLERAGYAAEQDDNEGPDDTVRAVVDTIEHLGEDGQSTEIRPEVAIIIEPNRNLREPTSEHAPDAVPVTTQSTTSQLPPNFDQTLPQFRPNTIAGQDFNELAGNAASSLPRNTTAPPEVPTAPEIPLPVPPAEHRDLTLPQFRPNSDAAHPSRTSSRNPPPPTAEDLNLERNAISVLTSLNSDSMTLDPSLFTSAASSEDESSSSHERDNNDDDDEDGDENDSDASDSDSDADGAFDPDHPNNLLGPIPLERHRDAIQTSNLAAQQPNPHLAEAHARRATHRASPPSEPRLARLAVLQGMENGFAASGGGGGVKGEGARSEFEEAMSGRAGSTLLGSL
ncbi:uncharacterized protein K452DRAFT_288427 [Aplosporella prunicola CBS 121167]|uniref:EF-hand n=1 Tax=Aplosporella prunicola CBS 121167 TaxID=1176127 RepID=A0A6A6BDQ5_9PEZI|nr:uncharacterized protein K452DRAFT_288427 [Aplosporella prunicola CBS 121167]KAF2141047.1 hypothetical protein K452DRAFT_288427 [Aplosporella prunicola CBS 121167]